MEATKQSTIGDSSLKGKAIRDAASNISLVTAAATATTTNNNKQLKYSPTCFSIEQLKQMTVTFAPPPNSKNDDCRQKAIQLQETFHQNDGRIEFMIRDLHSKQLRSATNDDLKYRSLKDIEICISFPKESRNNIASCKKLKKKSKIDTMTEHKTTSTMSKKKKGFSHTSQQSTTKDKTKTKKKTSSLFSSSSKMTYDHDKKQNNSAALLSKDKWNEISAIKKKKKKLRMANQNRTASFAVGDLVDNMKPNAATKNITFSTTESSSITSIKRKRSVDDNYDDNDDDDDNDEDYYEKESFKNKKCRRTKTATSPKILRTNSSGSTGSSGTVEVYSGIATEPELEGLGWIKKEFLRLNGATRGTRDKYWYTPVLNKKIRSMAQVREFLNCLDLSNMDEEEAWKLLQKSKTIKNTPIQGDVF